MHACVGPQVDRLLALDHYLHGDSRPMFKAEEKPLHTAAPTEVSGAIIMLPYILSSWPFF